MNNQGISNEKAIAIIEDVEKINKEVIDLIDRDDFNKNVTETGLFKKKHQSIDDVLRDLMNVEGVVYKDELGKMHRLTYGKAIAKKLIDKAMGGDMTAIKYVCDRESGSPINRMLTRNLRPSTEEDTKHPITEEESRLVQLFKR